MSPKPIIAIILIMIGAVVLCYSGIGFTAIGKPVEFLGLHISTTQHHFIPPVAGAIALVGGIVLLVVDSNRKVGC